MPNSRNNNEDDKHRDQDWHLEKNISIGHIITTMMVAISLVTWGMRIDTRLSLAEAELMRQHETDKRLEEQMKESITHIEALLIRIDQKLDGKVDKR